MHSNKITARREIMETKDNSSKLQHPYKPPHRDYSADALEALCEAKLEQARRYEESEGLKVALEIDPVAQVRVKLGGKNLGLDAFISLREQNFPDYFTVKQAEALFPRHDFSAYTQKGTPKYNHVPRDVALDDLTKELNMTPDEIADRVMQIRDEKSRIRKLAVAEDITPPPPTPPPQSIIPPPIPVEPKPTGGEITRIITQSQEQVRLGQ